MPHGQRASFDLLVIAEDFGLMEGAVSDNHVSDGVCLTESKFQNKRAAGAQVFRRVSDNRSQKIQAIYAILNMVGHARLR